MSEFQDYATKIVIASISNFPCIDIEKSYWVKERRVYYGYRSYGRQDIYAHIEFNGGSYRDICIEIKSGSVDFNSGYGKNFTEDFNFLLFEVGHGVSGILRTKHLKTLEKDIGILAIKQGIVYCLRPALPKSIKEDWMKLLFSLCIGEPVRDKEVFEEEIDGMFRIA